MNQVCDKNPKNSDFKKVEHYLSLIENVGKSLVPAPTAVVIHKVCSCSCIILVFHLQDHFMV